jgi:amino acid adenylation domain-containing protein/non-ribosomal peptide synthase protein (TIGR01720 family)
VNETTFEAKLGRILKLTAAKKTISDMQQEHFIGSFQLSPQQKRLWLLQRDGAAYRVQAAVSIEGDVDVVALRDACRDVVQRHEILRTDFHLQTGADVPTQIVDDAISPPLREQDLTELTLAEGEAAIEQLFSEALRSPLRCDQVLPRRLTIIALSAHKHVMLIELPALCADHATLTNLLSELVRSYTDRLNGGRNDDECLQYAELSTWLNELLESDETKVGREYWLKQPIADSQLTHLLFEKRPVGKVEFAPQFISSRVDQSLAEKLRMLARQEQTTLPILLLAAWQILLWRLSGKPEVLVGVAYDGRRFEETQHALGMLTRYLPVQTLFAETGPITEVLKQLDQRTKEIEKWQEYFSWDELAGTSANAESAPFFSVLFDFHQLPVLGGDGDLTFSFVREYSCLDRFKLRLSCTANADVLDLQLYYDPAYFDLNDVERIGREFQQLLKSICAEPEIPIGELNLLDEVERERLLIEFNETRVAYPADRSVHEMFEEQVERRPKTTAVVFGEARLSYGELNGRANQLAHYLRKEGVGPDVLVGICAERSLEMVVGLLAILKAGGAYVPFDPTYPEARLSYMMADAEVGILLCQQHLLDRIPVSAARQICLDALPAAVAEERSENPRSKVQAENLAYVIYTSGSTGQPKGVAISHQSLVNHSLAVSAAYGLTVNDRILQFASISFDVAAEEIFSALLSGASILLPGEKVVDSMGLLRLIEDEKLSVLNLPAPFWHAWVRELAATNRRVPPCLRLLVVGSEKVSLEAFDAWRRFAPGARVINAYGTSETTITSTLYEREESAPAAGIGASFPIGRPIANTQIYILDKQLTLAPQGVAGEIYIAGQGLGRGYYRRPELTAERFVANPFSETAGARMYQTGDLGRFLAGGEIEFLGRVDHQVKIRGFRIELGEIEAVLQQHEAVQQAVVVAQAAPSGGQRLVAYVTRDRGTESSGQLQNYLSETLPDYMVPASFVWLDALPLTPNGKVDRQGLTLMKVPTNQTGEGFAAPRTPVEEKLAAIWCEVLRCEQVGIHDNFLELGGDSILSIQVVARASRAGLHLMPRDLFEHPTVAALAEVVGRARAVTAEQGAVTGVLPLTPVQRSFFAEQQAEPQHYNQSVMLRISEPRYTAEVLRQVMSAVVAQHDALRLRFTQSEDGWEQFNAAAEENNFFSVVDLRHLTGAEQTAALEADAAAQQASLNLSAGPLLRVCYYDLGANTPARLLIIIHHLAVDGVSWRILLEDVASGCEQAAAGQAEMNLGAKTTSYKEWAERLREYARGDEVKEQGEYWARVARRARQVKRLPVDHEGGENTVSGARAVEVSLTQAETTALLSEVPAVYRTEINEVLLTALVTALGNWTGERRVLLELEGHGREEIGEGVDVTRTVGWFTTIYPVVLEVSAGAGEGEALKSVKEQVRGVRGRGLGWGLLGEAEEITGVEAELGFNYLGQFDQMFSESSPFSLAAESTGAERSPRCRRRYLVDITGSVFEGRLHTSWTYNENVHRRETIEPVAEDFISALRNLIAHCQSPEAGGYTPSDFPDTELSQSELDELIANMGQPEMQG